MHQTKGPGWNLRDAFVASFSRFRRPACLALAALISAPFSQASAQNEIERAIGLAVAAQYEEALELFQIELMRRPEDPLLGYYVGMTELKLERFSRAIANFEESIDNGADFPQVFHWLAEAYLRKSMPERAASTLRKGLERFPLNEDLRALAEELGVN